MYHVRPCPIGKIHGHPKFTVIQKKTKQIKKNEQPTMGVLPTVPHKLDQNSISENPKILS
jgi:hypothetical protein